MILIIAMACFAVQLLSCFKARKTAVKCIPVFILLAAWGSVLLVCTGIFGEGVGFLGNVHLMAAAILAIVLGIASLGNMVAWIVYKVCTYRKQKRQ